MQQRPIISGLATARLRGLSLGVWTGLAISATVLAARRLSGPFPATLPAIPACTIVTLAVLLSLAAHAMFRRSARGGLAGRIQITAGIATLLPPFVLAVLLLPAGSAAAITYGATLFLFSAAGMIVLGDAAAFGGSDGSAEESGATGILPVLKTRGSKKTAALSKRQCHPQQSEIEQSCRAGSSLPEFTQHTSSSGGSLTYATVEPTVASRVSQWMTRQVDDHGRESVHGAVRVQFLVGQKQAVIHLPFSPPLFGQPVVECTAADDAPVRFRVAAAQPYGVRIEAKRTGVCTMSETVEVEFSATAGQPDAHAA